MLPIDPFPLWAYMYKQINVIKCGRINKINVTSMSCVCPKQNIGKLLGSKHMEEAISDNNNRRIVNLAIL